MISNEVKEQKQQLLPRQICYEYKVQTLPCTNVVYNTQTYKTLLWAISL